MIEPAASTGLILAAPVAFLVGVLVGLWLSSFYRIVRRTNGAPPVRRDGSPPSAGTGSDSAADKDVPAGPQH